MQKQYKNIGSLYKDAFEDMEQKVDFSEWNELSYKLDKGDYYRFSITRFNIYYTALIVATFIFSFAVLIHHLVYINDQGKRSGGQSGNLNVQVKKDTIIRSGEKQKESYEIKSGKNIAPEKTGAGKKDKPKLQGSGTELNKQTLPDTSVKHISSSADTSKEIKKSADTVIAPPAKRKPPKIIYIPKQDTIIKFDTIRTRNKRKIK